MFRDKLFELEDFEGLKLPEDFNYLRDTLVSKAQGDHAKRVDEFPYFYELMDVYGFSFINKAEFIGALSCSPRLSLTMPRTNSNLTVRLYDVDSVSDFVDKIKEYADNFDVDHELDMLSELREEGVQGTYKSFSKDTLEKTCIDNKKSLVAFSESLLHWKNTDNGGLHQEFSNAQEQNTILRKAFPDSNVLNLHILKSAGAFLADLPTGKIGNKGADVKKEALDNAKGGSGKQAVRDSEVR